MTSDTEKTYTPALGFESLTPLYDVAIAILTRENVWRDRLVQAVSPSETDRILDVGCGTGTLALRLKNAAPEAEIIALDPDPRVPRYGAKKSGEN